MRTAGRHALAVLFAWPALLLAAAYLWLAADHGTLGLLRVPVHESGRHSLAGTVFYWRHFLREVPMAVLYALAIAGAWRAFGPEGPGRGGDEVRSGSAGPPVPGAGQGVRGVRKAAWAAVLLVGLAFLAAARGDGARIAAGDLLQEYTRDDLPAYGSHWRSHLVANLAFLGCAAGTASLLGRVRAGAFPVPRPGTRNVWIGGTLASMAVLTLVFRPTLEPLTDPRTIGHAAREAFTHLAITLPLGFGTLLAAGGRAAAPVPGRAGLPRDVAIALLLAALLLAFLVAGTFATGAVGAARPGVRLSSLVAAHAFEHVLDYGLVVLLVLAFAPAGRGAGPATGRPGP